MRDVETSSPRIDQGLDTNEKALFLLDEFLVGEKPRVAKLAEFA
jgi:hypothetical protein